MAATDGLLFIDTTQYLNFYEVIKVKKLLPLLIEQQEHVFVTTQIVEEVERNKVRIAERILDEHFAMLNVNKFNVLYHLFDVSDKTTDKLHEKLRPIVSQIDQIKKLLKNATRETLYRISRSEDKVTKDLNKLFRHAVKETTDELERARARKERGYPPGKQGDPLGDQLNWEQLLTQCRTQKKKRVWIVSSDEDYYTKNDGNCFLNPVLRQELKIAGAEVFFFDNLDKGIKDFVNRMGVKTEKLPTDEESKAIQDELNSLSFLSRRNPSISYYDNYSRYFLNASLLFPPQGQEDTPLVLKHANLGQEDTPVPSKTDTP
jgi:hypothetical protein